ncbi:MAG: peptidoglycan D,D-transpeptidase FtsI family protein [Lachnospiraceae bacterium]
MRKKLGVLFIGCLLALLALGVRIVYINASKGEEYKKQVLSQNQQQYDSQVIPYKRGDILDTNGTVLATSTKVYNIILDCKVLNSDEDYIEPTITALVEVYGLDEAAIRNIIAADETKNSPYIILAREISMEQKNNFESYSTFDEDTTLSKEEQAEMIATKANIKGVWFEEKYRRQYPLNSLASAVIGFTYSDNEAEWGLEGYYNSTLNGIDGRQYGYLNSNSDVEQVTLDPQNGNSIVTSLDVGAQQIVEKYINAFSSSVGAQNIGVIVENPNTGEIIAMGSQGSYDLNNPRDLTDTYTQEQIDAMTTEQQTEALNNKWRNYCISDAYETGSTVKPNVVAAALETGAISENDTFVCDGGWQFGSSSDQYIKCTAVHGTQTLAQVVANSCNDAMMQIAEKMGAESYLEQISIMNYGAKTGIDLPGEATGVLHTADTMGSVELATASFGQGYTATMIQEINAICSSINGGYYYQPHLVTKIVDENGNTVKSIEPTLLRQTVTSAVSADIRSYMQEAVLSGSSHISKVIGYSMGAKTGTAEKLPRGNEQYQVSYVGFSTVDNPEVVVYVTVDRPNALVQGNNVYAQYIGQGILSELLPYLKILPDETEGGTEPEATELWSGFEGNLDDNIITYADTVSNPNAPAPPEEESVVEDNNEQSDGITNEEAATQE